MTAKELDEYDALSKKDKVRYKRAKSEHPNWSHNQIMCYVAMPNKILRGELGGIIISGPDDSDWLK